MAQTHSQIHTWRRQRHMSFTFLTYRLLFTFFLYSGHNYTVSLTHNTHTHTRTHTHTQVHWCREECRDDSIWMKITCVVKWRLTDSLPRLTDHTVSVRVSHHASALLQSCQRQLNNFRLHQFPGDVWSLSDSSKGGFVKDFPSLWIWGNYFKDLLSCTFILKCPVWQTLIFLSFVNNKYLKRKKIVQHQRRKSKENSRVHGVFVSTRLWDTVNTVTVFLLHWCRDTHACPHAHTHKHTHTHIQQS